jgi:long-chain acyl-CoA synthetase
VLVTGEVTAASVQSALDAVNGDLPHYRQVRKFVVISKPFSAEDGLLTVMGKLRREAIDARFAKEIDEMYGVSIQ